MEPLQWAFLALLTVVVTGLLSAPADSRRPVTAVHVLFALSVLVAASLFVASLLRITLF